LLCGTDRASADELMALLAPDAVLTDEYPRRARVNVVAIAADDRGVAVRRQRYCPTLLGRAGGTGTDELAALLTSGAVLADEYPGCADIRVVAVSTDNRGVAVRRQCNSPALLGGAGCASADEFIALLAPYAVAAREHPRPACIRIVADPTDDRSVAVRRHRYREALRRSAHRAAADELIACWLHMSLLRVTTHTAPAAELSSHPPTIAVLPSAESATEVPCWGVPTPPVPTSFWPFCCHRPLARVNTHAAPVLVSSSEPPMIAVLPSADSPTDVASAAAPTAPLPTSLLPCCLNCASAGDDETRGATKSNAAAAAAAVIVLAKRNTHSPLPPPTARVPQP